MPSGTVKGQLIHLAKLHDAFDRAGVDYWLFGGWAVDFHVGRVTREHADIDIAIWHADLTRVAGILAALGWTHTPDRDESGYTAFQHGDVRLEAAYLARDEHGDVYTPPDDGRGEWPANSFEHDVGTLGGVRARIVSRASLIADKSTPRADASVAAKDRIDVANLRSVPIAHTLINKKAGNWVDRGEPPHRTIERVIGRLLDRNPDDAPAWFREQANVVVGMVDADASEVHVAAFLRTLVVPPSPERDATTVRAAAISVWHIAKAALVRDLAERVFRSDLRSREGTPDSLSHWLASRLLTPAQLAEFEDRDNSLDV